MKQLDQIIREHLSAVAEDTGAQLTNEITPDTVLLQTGMDSLGFAILVARLESELEYDPFVIMEKPCYPTTYGEFLAIYEKYAPQN
ncbi:MAG: acyl carrier protein [Verrucomicrobiae bacterium]|nr:acyl carrier protein [Verrucomicrobiae bacterium]NNJ42507.1 acyl carrier protein [Akkermansiaceae bacterium]